MGDKIKLHLKVAVRCIQQAEQGTPLEKIEMLNRANQSIVFAIKDLKQEATTNEKHQTTENPISDIIYCKK